MCSSASEAAAPFDKWLHRDAIAILVGSRYPISITTSGDGERAGEPHCLPPCLSRITGAHGGAVIANDQGFSQVQRR
jgi:hypothetical protein